MTINEISTNRKPTRLLKRIMLAITSLVGSLTIVAQELAPLAEAEWITGSTYAAMPRHKMAEGVALPIFRKVITCDAPYRLWCQRR